MNITQSKASFDCISGQECTMATPVSFTHAHLHEMHFRRVSFRNTDYHQDKGDRRELFGPDEPSHFFFLLSCSASPNRMLWCLPSCRNLRTERVHSGCPQTYRSMIHSYCWGCPDSVARKHRFQWMHLIIRCVLENRSGWLQKFPSVRPRLLYRLQLDRACPAFSVAVNAVPSCDNEWWLPGGLYCNVCRGRITTLFIR